MISSYIFSNGYLLMTVSVGHLPIDANDKLLAGRLGENMTVEEGKHAAKLVTLQLLSSMKLALGDLDKVKRIVKVFAVVNSTPDFVRQPEVVNGCSDFLAEVISSCIHPYDHYSYYYDAGVRKRNRKSRQVYDTILPLLVKPNDNNTFSSL